MSRKKLSKLVETQFRYMQKIMSGQELTREQWRCFMSVQRQARPVLLRNMIARAGNIVRSRVKAQLGK